MDIQIVGRNQRKFSLKIRIFSEVKNYHQIIEKYNEGKVVVLPKPLVSRK